MQSQDILAVHAAVRGDKPALIEGERTVLYRDLNARASRAGNLLASLGVQPGDRVALMQHNSTTGFEVSGGMRKIGVVGVPVNFRLRASEVAYLINDSGAKVVVAGENFVPVVDEARAALQGERIYLAVGKHVPRGWLPYQELMSESDEAEPASGASDGGLGASMVYTSGTTGHPKGAYRPKGLPLERIVEAVQAFGLGESDVHLMAGPGYHSAVGFFCVLTIALGGTIVVMPRFDAEEALGLIQRRRVSTTFMAPVLIQRILDLPEAARARYDVSSMRALVAGAAPFPFPLKERVVAYFKDCLYEFYGATETGVNLVLRPEEQLARPGSAGRPPAGHVIRLLDEAGQEVPVGVPGELWVRNDGLAEYYNQPDATAKSLHDGYFSVGDVAYRDGDGFYYICDRRIDMIISGGVNIYPAEVEACLAGHPDVLDVAVIGVPDAHWGESVKAVVSPRPGSSPSEAELIQWCRARIADYKRPRSVDFQPELPRDQAGKLLKRKIREPYWQDAGRSV